MKGVWKRTTAGLALVALAAVAFTATGAGAGVGPTAKQGALAGYPRAQTLISSGTQWGNIAGTNPYVGNYAAGMVGLVNETLLRFDPVKGTYINWLAASAKWTGPRQFTVNVRPGVKWADGKTFTGKDVAFNLNLLRFATSPWNNLYLNVKKPIAVHGNTVTINFKSVPNYVQWQNAMWNIPMISPTQAKDAITNAASLTTYSPGNPIGTGPYQMDSKGYDPTTRVVYVKKAHWWAADQGVSPSPKPKYIIDLVNTSNTNSLSAVLAGVEDLNNNYLPGVETLVDSGKVLTYFKSAPYMLSANTAWLEPNTTQKPLNDPAFRKALATAIDINKIVKEDYHNLVLPASPSGLLPTWSSYIDKAAVAANGFSFSTSKAVTMLQDAGYKKGSDGYFNNKDGSNINLDISVPQGWSDWEAARDMIVSSAKAAGIQITPKVKDFNTWQTDRNTGNFDLVIDNNITTGTGQTNFNFGRYSNTAAWNLVQKLDKTPLSSTAAIKSLNSQLQTTLMKDLPIIPLWYNGVWAQFTSKYWTNWPSSSTSAKYIPAMWRGYLQMTGIDMITHLKSK
jgi:peptide/nickel transport system substrate-binding protein